jgi:hypothetical protein
MSKGIDQEGKGPTLPPFLPPLIDKSIPASLRRRYDPDNPRTWGDQSIVLDEDDERILDKVWAEVARHPRMAVDSDTPGANGARTIGRRTGRRRAAAEDARLAESDSDGHFATELAASPAASG